MSAAIFIAESINFVGPRPTLPDFTPLLHEPAAKHPDLVRRLMLNAAGKLSTYTTGSSPEAIEAELCNPVAYLTHWLDHLKQAGCMPAKGFESFTHEDWEKAAAGVTKFLCK